MMSTLVHTRQGTHSLLLHARNLFLLERLAPRLHSLFRLVIQGCRPLRCLGLDTPVTPRDDELLARFERVLAVRVRITTQATPVFLPMYSFRGTLFHCAHAHIQTHPNTQTSPRPAIARSLRRLTCDDLSLEDEAATACMGRILARLPRLTMLELPNAQISNRGMGQVGVGFTEIQNGMESDRAHAGGPPPTLTILHFNTHRC